MIAERPSVIEFEHFFDTSADLLCVMDLQGNFRRLNHAWERTLGFTIAELMGKPLLDWVYSEDREKTQHELERFSTGTDSAAFETRLVARDDSLQWISWRMNSIPTDGVIYGIGRDITEQKWRGSVGLDDHDLLRALIDSLPDNVYVKDVRGRYVVDNITHAHFVGLRSTTEIVNKTVYDLFEKKLADRYTADDQAVINSGVPLLDREEPITGRDGSARWVSTSKVPLRNAGGVVVALVCISSDITRRKLAEDKLREQNVQLQELAASERALNDALRAAQAQMVQTEKMAALGQLVAGVAHEINNPLAFVTNNVAVLQRDYIEIVEMLHQYATANETLKRIDPAMAARFEEEAERIDLPYLMQNAREILSRSRDGLQRIRQIVSDLRDFARHETVGNREPAADLNPGIASTLNIVRGRARSNKVELKADLAQLPGVTCEPARINQVLLNLIVNAADACEHGGTVTVRSRGFADHVEIEISDTGCGIPQEIRDKIFEPFFTTKPQGKGTGLGLSISHGIIADHGGSIDVQSEMGKGSTFTIRLPLVPPSQK